jgi:dCMP deaminase
MGKQRQGWDDYFMTIAHAVATRSTCDRKHVGCVLVREQRIIATGYNGSIPGAPHCDDAGHDMDEGHCVRTIHAETNAVTQAARFGIVTYMAYAYVNTFPCWPCFRVLASAGVIRIVYDDDYREDPRVRAAAREACVMLDRIPGAR